MNVIREGDKGDPRKLRRLCEKWLSRTYGYRNCEWGYVGITPRIIAEELVTSKDGRLAGDIKFHVTGGRVADIYRMENRFTDLQECHLGPDWKPLIDNVPEVTVGPE